MTGVTVNLTTNVNTGGDAAGDTITGINNVYGSMLADTLTGNDDANDFRGMGGADTFYGMGGNDRIAARTNTALVDGGANSAGGFDNLVVEALTRIKLDDAHFTGIERVTVYGGASLDLSAVSADVPGLINSNSTAALGGATIKGTQGADRIQAGDGGDTITGGKGDDVLLSGSGADTFRYDAKGFGRDIVNYIDTARDHLDLSALASSADDLTFKASADGATTTIRVKGGAKSDAIVLTGVTVDQAKTAGFIQYGSSSNAAQASSLHQMVQAMATMTPSSSAALTPSAPPQAAETHLAAAHA